MLVLDTPLSNRCADYNALVFDLPDGTRLRVWLKQIKTSANRVRCVIDAPRAVAVTRGKLLGEAARGPEEKS